MSRALLPRFNFHSTEKPTKKTEKRAAKETRQLAEYVLCGPGSEGPVARRGGMVGGASRLSRRRRRTPPPPPLPLPAHTHSSSLAAAEATPCGGSRRGRATAARRSQVVHQVGERLPPTHATPARDRTRAGYACRRRTETPSRAHSTEKPAKKNRKNARRAKPKTARSTYCRYRLTRVVRRGTGGDFWRLSRGPVLAKRVARAPGCWTG